MSQENLREIMRRLIFDREYQMLFIKDPQLAIQHSDYNFSEQEINALLKIDINNIITYQKNRMSSEIINLETFSCIRSA
jgi:hypothetical protein